MAKPMTAKQMKELRETGTVKAQWDSKYAALEEEVSRLREALEEYGAHQAACVAGQWRAGRPTAGGGYETLYGYGKHEKWYQHGESPECTCGLSEALNPKEKK